MVPTPAIARKPVPGFLQAAQPAGRAPPIANHFGIHVRCYPSCTSLSITCIIIISYISINHVHHYQSRASLSITCIVINLSVSLWNLSSISGICRLSPESGVSLWNLSSSPDSVIISSESVIISSESVVVSPESVVGLPLLNQL